MDNNVLICTSLDGSRPRSTTSIDPGSSGSNAYENVIGRIKHFNGRYKEMAGTRNSGTSML